MASVTQLGYLGINATDVAEWRVFATEVLGMQVADEEGDGTLYLRMDDRHHRLVIHPSGADDLAYIGWQVPDEEALEAIAAQVEAAGVPVERGTRADAETRRVLGLVHFREPSGIATEVFYGPEIARVPFYPSRAVSGFKTGLMGTGHLVVWVPDVGEGIRFYRDVLGFRISDARENAAFLHCNARHHSIGLFKMRPNTTQRIQHFMVEYNSIDDVGMANDLCLKRGDRFDRSLGRHPNDQMISFYVRNPGGFMTECGWGGRIVDDATWQIEMYSAGGSSLWGHHAEFERALTT